MIVGDGTTAENFIYNFGDLSEILWVCHDTPILSDGRADIKTALRMVEDSISTETHERVVISTQLKVGATDRLAAEFPSRTFAYVPENFPGQAPANILSRVVVGTHDARLWDYLRACITPIVPAVLMTPRSAEMVKHGLNGFLALSIKYAQELARVSLEHGAIPEEVARGLMTDRRIGERAYLRPDGELGPHLQREVFNLADLGMSVCLP